MEHPEVAYRLARNHQLELERAVAASRRSRPTRGRFAAILGAMAPRLLRRPASVFDRLHREAPAEAPFQATHRSSISSTR
jgi:hypothetical protein